MTKWRQAEPEIWHGNVAIQRPGLFRGRDSVRRFDSASKKTLTECIKEVALRAKPSKRKPKALKPPKHPVRPGRDLDTHRLFIRRKRTAWLIIEDNTAIKVLDSRTIRAAGLTIRLAKPIDPDTDVRTLQIFERQSSRKKGRNRPLSHRSYEINIVTYVPDPEERPPWDNPAGLDAGKVNALTDSDGRRYHHPEQQLSPHAEKIEELKAQQKRLKFRGRQWNKCQKAINRERKAQRGILENWEHQSAKAIAAEYSLVGVEKLNLNNLTRSARGTAENPGRNVRAKSGLNRSMLGMRLGALFTKIDRHCEKNGTLLVRVPPQGTSQTCPLCGFRAKENRKSQAEFLCLYCFLAAHADTIAAINVRTLVVRALLVLTLLWAYGCIKEAPRFRRRMGMPPLNDSLTLLAGRPGPKNLGPSCDGDTAPKAPGLRPTPLEPKLSI